VRVGWDVFNIPLDSVPDLEQQKEIWFTFNLVANFLDNPNFAPGGNVAKIARWIDSIQDGYPYDASMAAALAHAHWLLDDRARHLHHHNEFLRLTKTTPYWQMRVAQFPELLRLAHVDQAPSWFAGALPASLTRALPQREPETLLT
jgi:hypothetical protein